MKKTIRIAGEPKKYNGEFIYSAQFSPKSDPDAGWGWDYQVFTLFSPIELPYYDGFQNLHIRERGLWYGEMAYELEENAHEN